MSQTQLRQGVPPQCPLMPLPAMPMTQIPNRQFGLFDKLFKKAPEEEKVEPKDEEQEAEIVQDNDG